MLEGHYARGEFEALQQQIEGLQDQLHQQQALTAEYRALFEKEKRKAAAYLRAMGKEITLRMAAEGRGA